MVKNEGDDDEDEAAAVVTIVVDDVDMVVLVNGRRRLVVRGRSKMPPLERFWPPAAAFNGAVMVVQQAIAFWDQ